MPSFNATAGIIAVSGGATLFIPPRFSASPAVLQVAPGATNFSIGGGLASSSVTTPTLQRLTSYDRPAGLDDGIWQRHMVVQQTNAEAIEAAFVALSNQVTDLSTLVMQIQAAQALAQSASDDAATTREAQDLADSYTNPTSVGSFANDGTITIASHTRQYPISGTSVSVNGGAVSGFTAGQVVTVYYNDAGREGGTVTYIGTTSAVVQTKGKHIVATGTIPDPGGASTPGSSPQGPGYPSSPASDVQIYIP